MQQRQQQHIENDSAAAALYQLHAPPLFAYLRMHTPLREDAEDVLVDIFLAALEQEQFLKMHADEQRAWLWRVARNKVIDLYRLSTRHQVVPLEDVDQVLYAAEESAPEQKTLRQEEYARLHQSITRLSTLQQQVLRLRFVHGLRSADIATVLGKSEGAVRMLLSRTLNLLRSLYEQY